MTQRVEITQPAPPASEVSLSVRDVHLWMTTLELPRETIARLSTWLSQDERDRAARFRHERHRNKFTVARAMMRGVLAHYVDSRAQDIAFVYLPHGKPELAGTLRKSNIQFNLSHSGNIALCAVTRENAVGVDVEHIRELRDMQGLANRFFSADEAEQLEREQEDQQLASFFRCWTRKEAYVKAIGQGITCPLDSFAVSLTTEEPARLVHIDWDEAVAATWSMVTIDPAREYVGALATPAPIDSLETWVWKAPETV